MLSALQDPEAKQDRALQAAVKLVSEQTSLKALWESLTEDWDEFAKVIAAVDPKAKILERTRHWLEASNALGSHLDEEGRKLLLKYDDDQYERDYYRNIASFHLGFAAALSLGARTRGREA